MKKILFASIMLGAILCACSVNEPKDPVSEDGAIAKGGFSVSAAKTVLFSRGNLQYQQSTDTWRFAEHQYDCLRKANKNIDSIGDGWIDLFGWGTATSPMKHDFDYATYSFTDWGTNAISNGGNTPGLWRTLTYEEWNYLREQRPNADSLYGAACIAATDSIGGAVLLPDDWQLPAGLTFNPGFSDAWTRNVYSEAEWQQMEAAGAVFLPEGGHRLNCAWGMGGRYWTSDPDGNQSAWCIYFTPIGFDKSFEEEGRGMGLSVRLVKDVE